MPNRLIVVALAAIGGVAVAAQPQPVTVRITSPVDNEFLSGLVKMVAVVEPAAIARQIKEVVFFADGRKICTLTRLPFECDWDAGANIEEHTVRVTVEMIKGGRTAASVHTKGLTLSESVDVDVLQFTAVVTDDDGRFVTDLKPSDFKVYDNDRAAEDHELRVGEHLARARRGAGRQLQHASGASVREDVREAVPGRPSRRRPGHGARRSTTTSSRSRQGARTRRHASRRST